MVDPSFRVKISEKNKTKIWKLFVVKKKSVNLKEMTWIRIHSILMRIQDPDPHQNWMDPKHWTCEFSDDFDIVFLDDFWFCMVMPNRKALIRLLGFRICCFYVFIAYKLEGPELPVKKMLSLEHPLANYESPQQISAHSVQPFVRLQGIYIYI